MECIKCVLFMVVTGLLSFILGRVLPDSWFDDSRFPYRPWKWEQSGKIYRKLKIQKWQNKVPDMSRILPKFIQSKKMSRNYQQELPVMIRETCIAELIHVLLCFTAPAYPAIWPGMGGLTVAVLYILGNIPFILIQRYNRPRLVKLQSRVSAK